TRRPPSTLRPSLTERLRLLREEHRVATVFDRHAMGAELRVQLPVLRQRCGFPRIALQDGPADAHAISRQRTVQTCAPLERIPEMIGGLAQHVSESGQPRFR